MTSIVRFCLVFSLAIFTVTGCTADDVDQVDHEVGTRAHFDVFQGPSGKWFFNLTGGNGETMASSEAYSSRTGALGGMLSVLDNGADHTRYQLLQATNGQFYFNLLAANGQVIATSETYTKKTSAKSAMFSVTQSVGSYIAYWNTRTGARFEIYVNAADELAFNLYAHNGEIVLRSESYSSEAAALNGMFAIVENGTSLSRYEVAESVDGRFYINLRARNGEIIGTSELYDSRGNAERAVEDLIELLPTIELL